MTPQALIDYCVALSANVIGTTNVGRVAGYINSSLYNVYANVAMIGTFDSSGHSTKNGANVTSAEWTTNAWWTGTAGWSSVFGATSSAPWKWNPVSQLPTLYWQELPVVNAATLSGGAVGTAYLSTVTATNSPTGFSLSALPAPPAWLSINNSGVLSGTPTSVGTFTSAVMASNAVGASLGGQVFSITVASAPPRTVTFNSQGGSRAGSGGGCASAAAFIAILALAAVLPGRKAMGRCFKPRNGTKFP